MSPSEPAGSARTKNGNVEAVCVSATNIGPAPNDTMSHAEATLCMNVPMSEMTSARNRFLKVGVRRGLQRLAGPSAGRTLSGAPVGGGIYTIPLMLGGTVTHREYF